MGPKKVDWTAVEREYVTEGKSARQLAREYGLSNSTISAKARTEDWDGKRQIFKNAIARREHERVADAIASEKAEIKKESVLAARLYLRKFITDVQSGKIPTNAKDAATMIAVLRAETADGDAPGTKDGPTVIEVNGSPDTALLQRILELARQRRAVSEGLGHAVLGDSAPTRPN